MDYGPDWRPPWRETVQARCRGRLCVADGLPGVWVIASTLSADGFCASCADGPANSRTLDSVPEETATRVVEVEPVPVPVGVEQLTLGL